MNPVSKEIRTAQEDAPRLDLWLKNCFPEHSRSMLQRLIHEGRVRLDGQVCTPKSQIRKGALIEIEFPPPELSALQPEAIPLNILFEDEHLLVLNKPAGVVVHPGAGHAIHTLVHALLYHCQGQLSGVGGVQRPGIIHRLDKDTSGCMVVAKSDQVHRKLASCFQSCSVEKIYLALVWGKPRMLSGKIDKPIGRHPIHRQRMSIQANGRSALTNWKVVKTFTDFTLLECKIHTGRTHQIRVHLTSEGLPIVGDSLYGRSQKADSLRKIAKRQMLHSWRLRFEHPISHTQISCEAPIPEDMQHFLE